MTVIVSHSPLGIILMDISVKFKSQCDTKHTHTCIYICWNEQSFHSTTPLSCSLSYKVSIPPCRHYSILYGSANFWNIQIILNKSFKAKYFWRQDPVVRWRRHDQSFLLVFYTLFFMDLYTLARSEDDCTNLTCSNNNCSECRHHGYPRFYLSAVFFFCVCVSLAILVQSTVQYCSERL